MIYKKQNFARNSIDYLVFTKQIKNRKNRNTNRSFHGFTLVELLAVIVILAVIALITTPVVLGQIETVKKKSFTLSATNVLDAVNLYIAMDHSIPAEGIEPKDLDMKNNEHYRGLIFQNQNGLFILKNFTDGNYCASGSRVDLVVRKGDCDKEMNLYPGLSLSIKEKTTKKITVVAMASDDTGIQEYAYCLSECENDENWEASNKYEYTFDSLINSKNYEIHVRATNRIDKQTEKTIQVMTEALPSASYNVTPSGWATSKTVTITYPNNVENYVIVHSGIAKLNGDILPLGEKRKISGKNPQVIFETKGAIEAVTSDGYNEVSSSTLTISQIDVTNPGNVSVVIGTVTTNSIQVIANGVDLESGIAKYEFQTNNGEWIDNGTNNTYLFSNLTSGSYTYKVRLTNKAGGVTESSETVQATATISTPSYNISPSGWATNKTAKITYQSGYTNQFRVLTGTAIYNGTAVTNNNWITISGSIAEIIFNSNGSIEARSTDGINTVTSSALTISQIDTISPIINSLSVTSTSGSYNLLTTTINSNVTDNSGLALQMYLSNTGYESGGAWEDYTTVKVWNVEGPLDGGARFIYLTYMDQAGNKVNRTINYLVSECIDTYPEFTFDTETNTITGYTGTAIDLVIPSQLKRSCETYTVLEIGKSAFIKKGLTSVSLPNTLKKINASAFNNNQITELVIPDSVEELSTVSFRGNTSLKKVTIGSGLKKLGTLENDDLIPLLEEDINYYCENSGWGTMTRMRSPFYGSFSIEEFVVSNQNPYFKSVDKAIYTKDGKWLVLGTKLTAKSIASGTIGVGMNAFQELPIDQVILPSTIKYIGEYAFQTTNIVSIQIPNSVINIAGQAFAKTKLTNVTIGSGITDVGWSSFSNIDNQTIYVNINKRESLIRYYKCGPKSFPNENAITFIP